MLSSEQEYAGGVSGGKRVRGGDSLPLAPLQGRRVRSHRAGCIQIFREVKKK